MDDNPDHLELLADLLRERGYEVTEARDASEALRVISDQKPHACVIDIGLPDMDGYELARKLREIPETRDSRLIAVTGYGTKADTHLFEEAGFDHYFPKPTNIEELSQGPALNAAQAGRPGREAVAYDGGRARATKRPRGSDAISGEASSAGPGCFVAQLLRAPLARAVGRPSTSWASLSR